MLISRWRSGVRAGRLLGGAAVVCTVLLLSSGCAEKSACCEADCCKPDADKPAEKSTEKPAGDAVSYTHTLKSDAEYYVDSPAQGRPPDGKLKAGTHVTLVSEHGSYARVKAVDGVEGFVSSAALQAK